MRASLGGLLVALGWLTFAQAAHNVMVNHSETSQLTYLPASAWVEVELEAGVRAIRSFVPLRRVDGTCLPRISIIAQQPWRQLLVRK